MTILKDTRIQLFTLYVGIVLCLMFRINIESTGYTTPDSDFYMRATDNFLNGKGFVTPTTYPFDENTPESHLAIWPIGYPALITIVSFVTDLDSFVSSKIVNVISLAFIFILLYQWYGKYSLLPACYFCSFGKLEVFSYTWSEGAFLFFVLWLMHLLYKELKHEESYSNAIQLICCLTGIVLVRYAGLIYFFYIACLIVILLIRKKYGLVKRLIIITFIASTLVFSYLLSNHYLTGGFFSGEPRIFPEMESWLYFISSFFDGFINELFLSRNFYWEWDPLFTALFFIQICLCYYIFSIRSHIVRNTFQSTQSVLLISSSLFYLVFMLILRRLSPFEPFDYRILAPFSTPVFISLLGNLRFTDERKSLYPTIAIVSFFILSLVMNVPKVFLLNWLGIV